MTEFNWAFPYPSRRAPVLARNVVTSSQPLASDAGLQMLREGGNAVDAALASAITLTVVEPCSNGVGSDAFAQIYDNGQLYGYSGNGRSPKEWSLSRFDRYSEVPNLGWDSITVPGAVRTWSDVHQRFGKLPFQRLFKPAIEYAERGFHVGPRTALHWKSAAHLYQDFEPFCKHFLPHGNAPAVGDLFKRTELADTLRSIAESNGESFYRGDLAKSIATQAVAEGGAMREEDLQDHQGRWTEPISTTWGDIQLHELPPSGQGLAALIALGILRHVDKSDLQFQSDSWYHNQIEAMKVAIRAAFDHIADPDYMPESTNVATLLDDESLERAAAAIGTSASTQDPVALPTSADTVCLSTADESGQMVSFIQSNFRGFGSGIVIEGTGIAMQNRGCGFVLTPNHPNQVGPSKLPYHTIIPAFVTSTSGEPLAAFGLMGGHMQHQGHVQMILRMFGGNQNPQAASDAPRWYVAPDYRVFVEEGFYDRRIMQLVNRNHGIYVSANEDMFGGAQIVCRLESGYCAASDHRKEGCAVGF